MEKCNNSIIKSKIIVIVSKLDAAGMNMRNYLINNTNLTSENFDIPSHWPDGDYELLVSPMFAILTIPDRQIFTDYFCNCFETELLIYASKHSSAASVKSLTVHITGIFGEASDYGGKSYTLSPCPSAITTFAYSQIKKYHQESNLNEYIVSLEVTHHGPSLNYPILFIESGGTENEWNDVNACNLLGKVIIDIIEKYDTIIDKYPAFIGIGGPHYASTFTRLINRGNIQYGHILPKYAAHLISEQIIREMWNKTLARNKIFIIDKKGIKSTDRKKTIEIIEKNGWPWEYAHNYSINQYT